jgi:cell division protein FtsQ
MLFVAVALLVLGHPDRRLAALAQVERAAELAGLGLQQVTLTGHRFTTDSDIYAALELDNIRTLLTFDARAAQARIEELPWIERASIDRMGPDSIDVRVFERVPFAVWRSGEKNWLIDRSGRKLQVVPATLMPELLRVAGEGAAREAAALSAALAAFPQIARQVEVAERVGMRRWTLRLVGATSALLPAEGEAEALAQLARLLGAGLAGAKSIDLRVHARVLVRQGGDGAAPVEQAAAGRT